MEEEVIIKFVKTHPDAKLPTKAHNDDNCFDLYCVEDTNIKPSKRNPIGNVEIASGVVPVGIKVAYITPGYGFVIKPKSGLGFKHNLQPHLGEVDNGYRGDCAVKMYNFGDKRYVFEKGDKVAQIKIEKVYDTTIKWADEVEEANRGDAGFGSSGK